MSEIEFTVFVLELFAKVATDVFEYFFDLISNIEGMNIDLIDESKLDLNGFFDNVLSKFLLMLLELFVLEL